MLKGSEGFVFCPLKGLIAKDENSKSSIMGMDERFCIKFPGKLNWVQKYKNPVKSWRTHQDEEVF